MDAAPQALPTGTRLHELIIDRLLGRGGIGLVYTAEHAILHDTFVIKEFLPAELAHRQADLTVCPFPGKESLFEYLRAKFLEEGQMLLNLARPRSHPNLVAISDAFRANETVYLCMRYEESRTLAEVASERLLDEDTLTRWLLLLLDGLGHAHDHGVWHRDIKPSNILIRTDDSPLLIDFGAAHWERPDAQVTMIEQYTPKFAAPEQRLGGTKGPWTDIYSLAATWYFLITNTPPVQGILPADWMEPYQTRYSRRLLQAIDAALCFDHNKRPQTVAQWLELLRSDDSQNLLDDQPTLVAAVPLSDSDQPTLVAAAPLLDSDQPTLVATVSRPVSEQTTHQLASAAPKRWPLALMIVLALLSTVAAGFGWLWWTQPTPAGEPVAVDPPQHQEPDLVSTETTPVEPPPCTLDNAELCAFVEKIQALPLVRVAPSEQPQITFNKPAEGYREGDLFALDVVMPESSGGYLWLDFYGTQERIIHLLPTADDPAHFFDAQTLYTLGTKDADTCAYDPERCFIVSPPYGDNLVLAFWSHSPLFAAPLPEPVSTIADYLAALNEATQRFASQGDAFGIVFQYHLVTTGP